MRQLAELDETIGDVLPIELVKIMHAKKLYFVLCTTHVVESKRGSYLNFTFKV